MGVVQVSLIRPRTFLALVTKWLPSSRSVSLSKNSHTQSPWLNPAGISVTRQASAPLSRDHLRVSTLAAGSKSWISTRNR